MMKQPVMIKSFPNGITLVCSSTHSFLEIANAVRTKLTGSGKFFQQSKLSLRLEGRNFTKEETIYLSDIITELTGIEIVTVIDASQQDRFLEENRLQNLMDVPQMYARYIQGPIENGEVIKDDFSLVIIGDVHAGCSVQSNGNIHIFGTLAGEAVAGAEGRKRAVVTANAIEEGMISIAGISIGDVNSKKPVKAYIRKSDIALEDYAGKQVKRKKGLF